ncbi:hypothetical protein VW29_04915 [Devosia limi DSM 17137]|uniref:Outer membrane protein OmpA n=1 Tax=Devosia limi DSM 17137 TaxID=1121477 RepID=A0A0F5LU91_9HYPH|nr:OmpA family protein [Devosia limi]KKB85950.1 hypothetical protein VW29_04915 [Devosia limi DSM 17137]SHF00844.1 Outer membrane protein OmpA [Devosia limi DSM 17137]
MRIRNWLLTGTSLGLLAFAPLSVRAQDGGLIAAYQAYAAAQSSGDAAALETAQAAFTEQCIVAGYASIDECIAALNAPAAEPAPPPVEEPVAEPAPEPEAAPEVIEEPAPEPEPTLEAPAPEVEIAPEPEPEASPEPEPAPELTAEPEPAPAAEPAAAVEAPAEQPAPAIEAPVAEQPAPEVEQPAAEPAPAVEQPAEEAPVAPVEAPSADITAGLQAQVDLYNSAVADMMAGGDAATAQAQLAAAQAEITALCSSAGYADIQQCLAERGLELPSVPNMPAPTPAEPAVTPAEQPAAEAPVEAAPAEIIEDMPQGITEEQIAPVLDSAKDLDIAPVDGQTAPATPPVAETPIAAPPVDDAAAQSAFTATEAPMPVAEERGEAVTLQALEPQQLPQNVTVINQTNVVNNVTNNTTTTNNTVNNTTNNTQNNIVDNSTNVAVQNNLADLTQIILQVGTQLIVNTPGQDTDRFFDNQQDEVFYERLSNGRVRETIQRADGSQIVTVRNRNGDILRRSRITPEGREYVLAYFDERYDNDLLEWRDPGLDLPPLRLNIPVRDYVLDARDADQRQVETFFRQPPVEQVARLYSIDEVKRSARVRDSVRKLEVGGLTFDTGAATISRDQVSSLSKVANAMLDLLDTNPAETFLIEGHTDAVGSDISNLQLSDLRAATVARILTDFYGVPPENLATQGYGERYLKIRTEAGERENRRVTIRRITPLITMASN